MKSVEEPQMNIVKWRKPIWKDQFARIWGGGKD